MFQVNTHGWQHRLTIVATDTRSEYRNVMRFDSGKDGNFTELMFHDGGMSIELDWHLIAAMICRAYKEGLLQPKHVYRVPAWVKMPDEYRQALFNLFTEA